MSLAESFNDALIECVKAAGGSSQVGRKLWPEKTPEAAQRLLLDCLNEDRPARLAPEQVLFVLKLARAKGCHVGMQYLCDELSYADPQPIEPKDEAAELRRQYIEAAKNMARMAERIEALERVPVRAVA